MRLPFFRNKTPDTPPAPRRRAKATAEGAMPLDEDAVAAARTRARRRLVGALVLLAIGVIGFPLLFETQPRPLPMETPVLAPAREATTAVLPASPPAVRPLPPVAVPPADAGLEVAAPASAPAESSVARVALSPPSAPAPVAVAAPAAASRAAPAPAAAASAAGRFVVQIGAYTDANTLRDARAKVEKLGLKTYTQVLDADGAKPRTRVRVGPFATREDADAAAARLKRAGLPANILAL
ncbi:MAG: SPOR domain-containing protein [Rubrivivax sp.]|nr:SPOR domain-containing protein [Rubrivivax sp.]